MRILVLALPERFRSDLPSLPSANQTRTWLRLGQRWRYGQLSKAYAEAILEAKALRGIPWGEPAKRVIVTIKRVAARLFDEDNLIGGAKHLIDALVRAGIVENDRPENIRLVVAQERATKKKKPRRGEVQPWRGVAVSVVEEECVSADSTPRPSPPSRTSSSATD